MVPIPPGQLLQLLVALAPRLLRTIPEGSSEDVLSVFLGLADFNNDHVSPDPLEAWPPPLSSCLHHSPAPGVSAV